MSKENKGSCYGCVHAKFKDRDSEGRVFCKGEVGGYNFPEERRGCPHYASKIKTWIGVIVMIWFTLGILQLIVEMVF